MNGKKARALRKAIKKYVGEDNKLVRHPNKQISNDGWKRIYKDLKGKFKDGSIWDVLKTFGKS